MKSVTTTNFNNTGILATEVLGSNLAIPELAAYRKDAINFDLFPRFSAAPVTQVSDISSPIVPRNQLVANHTTVVTSNSLFRPSDKTQFKGILQYYRDAFTQSQSQITDYTPSGINLAIRNRQTLQRNIPSFTASAECIISPGSFNQLIYKAEISHIKRTDSLNDLRQTTETFSRDKMNNTRFQQQLGYSFAIDSSNIVDLRILHHKESSTQLQALYPADLYSVFTTDTGFQQILSAVNTGNTEYVFQARMTKKYKRSNWSAELLHSTNNAYLRSDATLMKVDAKQPLTDPSLINNAVLSSRIYDGIFTFNTALSKNLYLKTTHRLEAGLLTGNDKTISGKHYTQYLPSVSVNLGLNNQHNLRLNVDTRNRLPSLTSIAGGYIFGAGNTVIRGINHIRTGISKTVSFSYSFAETVKSRLIFYLVAFYSREPVLYLADIEPTAFYTVRNMLAYDKNMTAVTVNTAVSKYVRAIKSQVSVDAQVSRFGNFYSANNQQRNLDISSSSASIRCKSLVTDKLTTNFFVKAVFRGQVVDKGSAAFRENTSRTFTYHTELVYRLNKRWVANARHDYITQYQGGNHYSLHLGEFLVKYTAIKDRLYFMLSGNNLFNGQQFSHVSFTQYSISTQSIDMIRPYLMLQASLEL